ncbi:U-box domain protein, putative [Leishmania tarentolae]|uniref:U-box domain protein, putative n=1 Tax=Leishmania tarentolae TaxID=5689 RepID=A0A640KKT9_LEITA|nr:U-box domain protein, putative [Leishmania tarentolae]
MANIGELDAYFQSGAAIDDAKLDQWIGMSDISYADGFYIGDAAAVRGAVHRISRIVVEQYLNNADVNAVPLRRKTKFCLLLNNFSLYKPVRSVVFECLGDMTSIFEKSIKDEGTMPFDSELGRMSEHVLVLLMRVMDYKLKAAAVHEFAEHNTQFAIQLLLAILLKEPPYEFELRCNCISGLLGFTQPQAFFGAGEKIEEHSCIKFTEKVDFMLKLMLSLQAIQVVSDVLGDAIACSDTVPPLTQNAVNNTMQTIMNIFKFSSEGTQWRQHILLSTTFLDGTVMMYVQSLASNLHETMSAPAPRVAGELLHSLNLCFVFGAFATYHMEEASHELRIFCNFFHDLFQLSIRPIVTDARVSGQMMVMYISLLHFMCSVDAMGDESSYHTEGLLPELSSAALRSTVEAFLKKEVGGCGLPFTEAWYRQFRRVTTDTFITQDSNTFQWIDSCFLSMISHLTEQQVPVVAPAAPAGGVRLLREMPVRKPEKKNKISIDKAAAPIRHKVNPSVKKDSVEGVDADLLCALTGAVMKNPVSSPYGQTYEKEAIMNWLEQNGSVCPISGRPLTAAQLTPNTAVATKIMQQMVRQTMETQVVAEDDMYKF